MVFNTRTDIGRRVARNFDRGASNNHGWWNLFHSGGHKRRSKNNSKFFWFELANVTSQALKYDVITYTPYEGLKSKLHYFRQNYTTMKTYR